MTSCWDGKLLNYNPAQNNQYFGMHPMIEQKLCLDSTEPLLASCWKHDGSKIYVAADCKIKEVDV